MTRASNFSLEEINFCHVFIIDRALQSIVLHPNDPFMVMFLCAKKMRAHTGVRRIIRRLVVLVVGCLRLRVVLLLLIIRVGIVAASH